MNDTSHKDSSVVITGVEVIKGDGKNKIRKLKKNGANYWLDNRLVEGRDWLLFIFQPLGTLLCTLMIN